MPIYEYVCDSCGYGFERIQSFSDDALSECPRCSEAVRRVISPVGIIFKGSGWYITDSKRQLGSQTSSRGRRQLSGDRDGQGKSSSDESGESASSDSAESAEAPDKSEKSGKADKSDTSDKADKSKAAPDKKPSSKDGGG